MVEIKVPSIIKTTVCFSGSIFQLFHQVCDSLNDLTKKRHHKRPSFLAHVLIVQKNPNRTGQDRTHENLATLKDVITARQAILHMSHLSGNFIFDWNYSSLKMVSFYYYLLLGSYLSIGFFVCISIFHVPRHTHSQTVKYQCFVSLSASYSNTQDILKALLKHVVKLATHVIIHG